MGGTRQATGSARRLSGFLSRDGSRVGLVVAWAFAAGAVSSAYLPLWFADHGLSAAEIGTVLGAASLLRVVAGPAGGWAADQLGRPRTVLAVASGVAAASAAALPALRGVGPLLVVTATLGMSAALLSPLTDALALALARAGRLEYGRTRAWGSVSYLVATAAGGVLLSWTGSRVVPGLLAGAFAAAAGFAWRVPQVAAPGRSGGGGLGLWRERSFQLALGATALIQGSHAAYYAFAPLHWRSAGLSDTAIGLLIAEGVVAEVALFVWGRGLAEWLGPARLTGVAAGACAVRWTALAFVTAWPWLVLVQLLHVATFAFQHLSTMAVLRELPPERAGVAQTVVSALGFSAATAALVWLTGQLYGRWGGDAFLPMAAVGGAAGFIAGPLGRAVRKRQASAGG